MVNKAEYSGIPIRVLAKLSSWNFHS